MKKCTIKLVFTKKNITFAFGNKKTTDVRYNLLGENKLTMKLSRQLILVVYLLSALTINAQDTAISDSVKTENKQDNGIFLNAESDSKPRQISLGLPTTTTSVVQIFEDGMPVSYYIYQMYPFKSWHGGVSASSTSSMGPMETSMRYGEISFYADSKNRQGGDKFGGKLNYTIGTWGQHKIDVNISGPIARGWGYSLSTYQNFDPGSNHTISPELKDRHQFYKGVLSKKFHNGRGGMSLVYQYVDFVSIQENYGPFIFVGDGSVEEYPGFRLGIDSYRPEIGSFTFMDMKTGELRTMSYKDGNTDRTHHATFTLDYNLGKGIHLDVRSRFKTGTSVRGSGNLSGVENVNADAGYTYADGGVFSGKLQRRNVLHFDAFDTSWMNNAEIQMKRGNHKIRIGADYHHNHGGTITSSVNLAHEVKSDPKQLYFNGKDFYNYNTAGEYYSGYEHKIATYAKDEWKMTKDVDLAAFVRVEYLNIHGESANNINGDTSNNRYPGFNLTKGKITTFKENYLNGSVGLDLNIHISGGLSFKAQGIFNSVHNTIFDYGGFYDPNTNPTDTKFAQGGLAYKNEWINLVSQLVYINQSNYNTRSVFQHALTKEVAGYPAGFIESVTMPLTYNIESLGWTTDAMITPFKGFNLHAQITIRNPKYKDFIFSPTFSDNVTEHYDFSGKNVTNLHKVEVSLDPSYTYKEWRIWLSARYISKQYINKTNSLYFKERIETFGGIDYRLNTKCKLSMNVINILNQKGASGKISSADLVEDVSGYKNYLMSGTFIRPFTIEFGVNIDF